MAYYPKEEDHDTLRHVKQIYLALLNRWRAKRAAAETSFKAIKGGDEAWDQDILQALEDATLPHLNLNIIWPIAMRIFAAEMQRRGKLKAVPLNDVAVNNAQTFTKMFEVVDSHYDLYEQFGMAFKQTVCCDLPGCVRIPWARDRDLLGMPAPHWVSCFHVFYGEGQHKDLSDCREVVLSWFVSREELMESYPEKAREIKEAFDSYRGMGKLAKISQRLSDGYSRLFGATKEIAMDNVDEREGTMRIIQLYERNTKREMFKVGNDGLEKVPKEMENEVKESGAQTLQNRKSIITLTETVGDLILLREKTPLPVQNGRFPFFPVWGVNVDGDNKGLVPQLEGPADEYKKSRSAELHYIGTASNPGWQVEKGSLDPDEARKLQTKGGSMGYVQFYETGRNAPQRIQPANIPAAMQGRSLQAKQDAQFISSITDNPLGSKESSGESGKLFDSRVEESLATLMEFFNNLEFAERRAGEYMIDQFQHYVGNFERDFTNAETGETFTVNETIPWTPGVSIHTLDGKFSCKMEVAPTTLTQRREIANIMIQALQYTKDPRLQPLILKLLFEKLELPDEERLELVEMARRLIPPSATEQLQALETVGQFAEQGAAPVQATEPQF